MSIALEVKVNALVEKVAALETDVAEAQRVATEAHASAEKLERLLASLTRAKPGREAA